MRWLALLLPLLLVPRVALADAPPDEARAHYARGIELFNAGEHRLALVELQRAYEIAPTYRLLYYVGQAQIRTGALARALGTLERYLAEGGGDIDAARRAEVERDLEGLRARTAWLAVTSNVEGATVSLDGVEVGRTPLERRLVEAGSIRVALSKSGWESKTETVDLAGRDDRAVSIELAPASPAPAAPPATATPLTTALPPATRDRSGERTSVAPIVAWSAAGALGAGAVVTGILAVAAVERVDDARQAPISGTVEAAQADLESRRDAARGWMLATDILGGAALVTAGVALYFTLRDGGVRRAAIVPSPRGVRVSF